MLSSQYTADHLFSPRVVSPPGAFFQCGVARDISVAWLTRVAPSARQKLSKINRMRCKVATRELWTIAEDMILERYLALFDGYQGAIANQLYHSLNLILTPVGGEIHEQFVDLVTNKMTRRLFVPSYTSSMAELITEELFQTEPVDTSIFGKDPSDRYFSDSKFRKDKLLLAGKLIAEVEMLQLELVDYSLNSMPDLSTLPGITGLPARLLELLPYSRLEACEAVSSRVEAKRRRTHDRNVAARYAERSLAAKKVALSKSELLLKKSFQSR